MPRRPLDSVLVCARTHTAVDDFPDPEHALKTPDGLLAIGGGLTPARLMCGYQQGIFPWFNEPPILWWAPSARAVFDVEKSESSNLRRAQRYAGLSVSVNQAFGAVMRGCAERAEGTWLGEEMQAAYLALHLEGLATSIEVWRGNHTHSQLIGGIYGVFCRSVFFAESMFSREPGSSKIALYHLMHYVAMRGVRLIDAQFMTYHLAMLGAVEIPRTTLLAALGNE